MDSIDNILSALCEISKQQLSQIILNIPGTKDLIIDPSLMKPLDRVVGVSDLRKLCVNEMRKLDGNPLVSTSPDTNRVFLLKSDVATAKLACDKIAAEQHANTSLAYHFILVPCRLTSIEQMVEEEGLGGLVSMWALSWAPLRLDTNLLSLELPDIFSQLFVHQDQSMLCAVAKSLWLLEMILGKPQVTIKLGQYAKRVENIHEVYPNENGSGEEPRPGLLDCAILVDRDIDLASVLLTPATYTALLDEVVGLSCGVLELPEGGTQLLSNDDQVYSQIKNRHFSDVFTFLSQKAKQLNSERERCQRMEMKEMKEFVRNQLKGVTALKRSVATHIGCCEAIITALGSRFEGLLRVEQSLLKGVNRRESTSYIRECLATGSGSRPAALRLMCLHSLTQDGLPSASDEGASLKEQYLHAYGYKLLPVFHHLERLGLYSSGDATGRLASRVAQAVNLPKKSTFQATCERFKCFPTDSENVQLKQPTDMSYVFSGTYIPVVCQLVHMIINKKISLTDIGKMYPGVSMSGRVGPQTPLKTILVYFIGGVTYAEIAAFQLLESLTGTRIIVATTSMLNGNSLMESVFR